jgi:hypothetical protein
LPEAAVAAILHLRRTLRLTGAAIAATLGLARSTVARWLRRAGLGRLAQIDPPAPVRRDRRDPPGEPIHLDIKKLGRSGQPGHRVTLAPQRLPQPRRRMGRAMVRHGSEDHGKRPCRGG